MFTPMVVCMGLRKLNEENYSVSELSRTGAKVAKAPEKKIL